MKNKINLIWRRDEKGNILSFVIILLMSMSLLAMASMAFARNQGFMANFSRQTSNSYYLARSGAEKIVDSMNKEVATQLPRLMKDASKIAKRKLISTNSNNDGIAYSMQNNTDPYSGQYVVREQSDEYQVTLRQLVYEHIIEVFSANLNKEGLMNYSVYSDVERNKPIKVTSKLYYKGCPETPKELKEIVEGLATGTDIGETDGGVFLVEVIARAQDDMNIWLTKSEVIAIIKWDQIIQQDEEILEEYQWAIADFSNGNYPQVLESEQVSFEEVVDLIDLSIFQEPNQWSYNNPILILNESEIIDVSKFQQVPTAIIGRSSDVAITLGGVEIFNGIIITPGKVDFENELIMNGVVIAGQEGDKKEQVLATRSQIKHDRDILLKIRCMDKSLERRLYDCLKITNYRDTSDKSLVGKEQEKINVAIGKQDSRIIELSPLSIITSTRKGSWFAIKSLRKLSY